MRRMNFAAVLGIALGGACGALSRHAVGAAVQNAADPAHGFPWGTLVVNLLGCLAIGALAGYDARGGTLPAGTRLALAVGFLGGFTTFSSFGLETIRLLQAGEGVRAALYVAATNAVGLAAVALGFRLSGRG
jgi:fluoride exporter